MSESEESSESPESSNSSDFTVWDEDISGIEGRLEEVEVNVSHGIKTMFDCIEMKLAGKESSTT